MTKNIDFRQWEWPETNPIKLKVDGLHIQNYRWPSSQTEKKGIVQYINGFGDYAERGAYLAEPFV